MKTLIFLRHAKSDWNHGGSSDFDRPLNPRGRRDLPFMAGNFIKKGIVVDRLIASPANRARETVEMFAEAMKFDHDKIEFELDIYEVGREFLKLKISKLDASDNVVMFVGHNPDFSLLANLLSETNIGNMPTCSSVCIDFDTDDWSQVLTKQGKLRFFDYPKMFFKDISDD